MNYNIIEYLQKIQPEDIIFKYHFYLRTCDRTISEELVRKYINQIDRIQKIEEQKTGRENERKFKIWIKLSRRYSLVLIFAINQKTLYIITGWNSEIKWKK
jgi:hypothetical protein